jgi:glycosyltransferase involved in cell wall biosynthesis
MSLLRANRCSVKKDLFSACSASPEKRRASESRPMQKPTVSFVVPCYKLAHLLRECVDSILSQSHKDLEVLIMDDCSPDNTAEVAASFADSRVIYVKNESNIGHLNNYNKGINMARGQYVWLLSADDYLRRDYVVERYVRVMEEHPGVGLRVLPWCRRWRERDFGCCELGGFRERCSRRSRCYRQRL